MERSNRPFGRTILISTEPRQVVIPHRDLSFFVGCVIRKDDPARNFSFFDTTRQLSA